MIYKVASEIADPVFWQAVAAGCDGEPLRFASFCADRMVTALDPGRGEKLLDVACGSGPRLSRYNMMDWLLLGNIGKQMELIYHHQVRVFDTTLPTCRNTIVFDYTPFTLLGPKLAVCHLYYHYIT